jgi:membrane protein required for colicin V production
MQLLGLAGILLAVIFGGKLAEIILPQLGNLSNFTPETLHVLSYIIAFIGIFLVAIVVGRIVEKIVDFAFLGLFNRLLGGIVAIGTTMVVLSLSLNLLLFLDKREQIINERTKNESFFFERVQSIIPAIVPYLNRELWEKYIPEIYRREEIELEREGFNRVI